MKNAAPSSTPFFGAIFSSTLALLLPGALHAQGTFPPPTGPTVPIMKTLAQVEPRTPLPAGGPCSISAPGSYYLTGDIANPNGAVAAALTITSDNVTVDLNGFSVSGQGSSGGGDDAILISAKKNITIRNGTVKQAGYGIYVAQQSAAAGFRIDSVTCIDCYIAGIYTNSAIAGLFIVNCSIANIGNATLGGGSCFGIYIYAGAHVENCQIGYVTATGTGTSYGINADNHDFLIGNSVTNCMFGIRYGKYLNNLTYGCGTPFSGGTDAGGNN